MTPAVLLVSLAAGAADAGYVRSPIDEDKPGEGCQYWTDTLIPWVQADQGNTGPSPTPGDTEFAAVTASFQTWQAQSDACGNFTLQEGARVADRTVGYQQQAGAVNRNIVLFRPGLCSQLAPVGDPCFQGGTCGNKYDCFEYDPGNIAITTTTFSSRTGRIFDADVELNGSKVLTTVDSPPCPRTGPYSQACVAFDVQNTMTHEIGHFMGLGHASASTSTMYFQAGAGELIKRNLDPATRQFVCDVYPKGYPSQPCTIRPAGRDPMPVNGCGAAPGAVALAGLMVVVGGLAARRRWQRRPR
jgi:hypothetical protein